MPPFAPICGGMARTTSRLRRPAAWLAPALALAVLAAPAQARHDTPVPAPGGAPAGELLEVPAATAPVVAPPPVPGVLPPPGLELPPVTTSYVAGKVARLRTDGLAAIPRGAPKRVRRLISQYNRIVGKPYLWGGGHAAVEDRGYDCSGAVGYGLIKVGILRAPMVSGGFARWAAAGPGRWVTVYANRDHVYAEIAGLRLDTSPYGDRTGGRGVRWRAPVGPRRAFRVRHPVGL